MLYLKSELSRMYALSGIRLDTLNTAQKIMVEQLLSRLIRQCNQNDEPLESISDALKEIHALLEEDPLFKK